MKRLLISLSAVALSAGLAQANDSVLTGTKNPNDWVLQTGDYANTRYSKLNQITRHMLGLFAGRPGARNWRRMLSEGVSKPGAGPELVLAALGEIEALAAA